MNSAKLLHLPYAGNVWHWARLAGHGANIFDGCSVYRRRTFRNRTIVMAANGTMALTVPVQGTEGMPFRDTLIFYETDWADHQMKTLKSAYNNTPFYEFYADDIGALLAKRHKYLWDLNLEMMQLLASLIGVDVDFRVAKSADEVPADACDLRLGIEPKHAGKLSAGVADVPYYQVFAEKSGFVPSLSVFDLLFNMGPESLLVLRQMSDDISKTI